MEITNVRVHKIDKEGSRLRGYATVTIDNCFVVSNIRIIEGENRLFCAMPSRKVNDEKFEDIVHPTNSETREMFESKILEEYNNPTNVEKTVRFVLFFFNFHILYWEDYMESILDTTSYGSHEIKITDRSIISLSGINKISSFDDQEFLMESTMGIILLKGEGLEIVKLDTHDGNVKIKGKLISFAYIENVKKGKEESLLSKLFK